MILGHRGYMSKFQENTLDSFKQSRKNKIGIELDVLLTKDNVVVCCHDENLFRLTGYNLQLSKIPFSRLCNLKIKKEIKYQSKVYKYQKANKFCSLEEVIEELGNVFINIEIKSYTNHDLEYKKRLCDLIINIINYRKLKKYILSSYDIVIVDYLISKGFNCILVCDYYIENNYPKIIDILNYNKNQKNIVGAFGLKNTNINLKYLIMDF